MFIDPAVQPETALQRCARNVSRTGYISLRWSEEESLGVVFYKHWVPTGRKPARRTLLEGKQEASVRFAEVAQGERACPLFGQSRLTYELPAFVSDSPLIIVAGA